MAMTTWFQNVCCNSTTLSTSSVTTDESVASTAVDPANVTLYYNDTTGNATESVGARFEGNVSTKYPYRICSMSQGTDMVRFARTIECPAYSPRAESMEGILLIYKENIVPYTFKVYTYSKELFFQKSYKYIQTSYLLSSSKEYVGVPLWEVHTVNNRGVCYASYRRGYGEHTYVVYHKDDYANHTMWLFPADFHSANTRRYITVKEHWHEYGSVWLYKETCSINCIVTETVARSKYPYDFFVLSSGVVVEGSPFYDKTNNKTFNEDVRKFHVYKNYTMLSQFGVANPPYKVIPKMGFLEQVEVSIGWEIEAEHEVTCKMKHWETVNRAVRTDTGESLHFTSRSLTATFVAKESDRVNISAYDCIQDEVNKTMHKVYAEDYAETHERDGSPIAYKTSAGLLAIWQSLKPKSLHALEEAHNITMNGTSSPKRSRRSVTPAHNDVTYAQLQFTYDTLRDYINHALGNIAEAWCLEQKRTAEMLKELSKINPSAILSAVYDSPVAARALGDVIALAKCVEVDQESIHIMKDMRVTGEDGRVVACYSRPVVKFQFVNSTEIQTGQLGEDNEILLGSYRTEKCQEPSIKVFIAGGKGYEYRNHVYKNNVDLRTVEIVNTMIELNIRPLENADFNILQLYSEGELRAANIFDLESIMREYNANKQTLRYLETTVNDHVPSYLRGLDDFMSGLGSAGKGVGVVLGAVAGVVSSIAGGIWNFFTNPFGTVTICLIAIAVIAIMFTVYQRQKSVISQPIQHLFPYVTQQTMDMSTSTRMEAPPPYSEVSYRSHKEQPPTAPVSGSSASLFTEQDALQMLKAMDALDKEQKEKEKKKAKESSRRRFNITDRFSRAGYSRLPTDE